MFGMKNKPAAQPDPNLVINQLFGDLATLLYGDVAAGKANVALKGTLIFDASQRISKLTNVTVDGSPKIPSFDAVEAMSKLATTTLAELPEIYALKSLELNVESDGSFGAAPTYLK